MRKTVMCRACGTVEINADRVTVMAWSNMLEPVLLYACPACKALEVMAASRDEAHELVDAGAQFRPCPASRAPSIKVRLSRRIPLGLRLIADDIRSLLRESSTPASYQPVNQHEVPS